ncbi:MAG: hypothetical protein V4812_01925 [Pseudomonadota bacterium]
MRPDRLPSSVRGFGLVAALFVMIVVSLVVIAMARLATTQHGSNSLAIQQARAYQAARAGLEWGIRQAYKGGTCSGSPDLAGSSLSEFTLVLSCESSTYTETDGSTLIMLRLSVDAHNGTPGSRPDYAFRRLSAVVER